MIDFSKFNSIISIMNYFTNDDVCKEAIIESRWGKGTEQDVICPYCGHHHCHKGYNGRFVCTHCERKFSCLVGTIFDNTKISLRKWFVAMYLISSHKKGISSCQLARDVEVTQKTAWFMLQKIRTLFPQDDSVALSGVIECDEVYIGGKERLKHQNKKTPGTQGRSTKTKTPIFGMSQRCFITNSKGKEEVMSYVHAIVVSKTDRATLQPIIEQFCESGSTIMTDELTSYNQLESAGYNHSVVNHGQSVYVDGEKYTNNIEGFWNHLRRMLTGTYHNVSVKYLQKYLDESVYRWNTRKQSEPERFITMFNKSIGNVIRHQELVKVA